MARFLITRKLSIAVCLIGVFEVLFGTCLALCGFIELGMFHRLAGDGFYTGFTLLIPGFLGVVALATRRKESIIAFLITNVITIVLCILHAVMSSNDVDYWKKYKNYVLDSKCYDRGDICSCPSDHDYKFYVQRCDLYSFGHDLFWALVAFNIVGAVLSGIGALVGLVGSCMKDKAPKDGVEKLGSPREPHVVAGSYRYHIRH
eukprot:gene13845-15293_t